MIEDCFISWYEKQFPELDPSLDDCYWSLRSAYYAGWGRYMEICAALEELQRLGQEYDGMKDD